MDIISRIKPADLASFAASYDYQVNGFMGHKLFPAQKSNNLKLAYRQLVENGDLPVMAQVHALDTEARIGDRTNFKELELHKLLIKEKLNQGERIAYLLNELNGKEDDIVRFVYNDAANLLSRVITRTEVANMELLSTGRMTIKENGVNLVIDYGFSDDNRIALNGWSNPDHDILGDLEKIVKKAKAQGWKVVRAITSGTIINYLVANKAIRAFWDGKVVPVTEKGILEFIDLHYGIEFVANDDVYKLSANGTEVKRFFDENAICFLGTRSEIGSGLFGVTPEELKLTETKKQEKMLCTLTMWESEDPATTWTKASGLYLPVIKDINKMIVAKVK